MSVHVDIRCLGSVSVDDVIYQHHISTSISPQRLAYSYLGQGGILCVDNDPTDLNHFRAVLGDIYSVLIASGSNVNDTVLVKLTLALTLVRGGARLRSRGWVCGVRLVLSRSSHG
jgi:hypothetical protein